MEVLHLGNLPLHPISRRDNPDYRAPCGVHIDLVTFGGDALERCCLAEKVDYGCMSMNRIDWQPDDSQEVT